MPMFKNSANSDHPSQNNKLVVFKDTVSVYLALNNTLFKLKMNTTFKLLSHHQGTAGSNSEGF